MHKRLKSKLICRVTKRNIIKTSLIIISFTSPFIYLFFMGQVYGMPDGVLAVVNCMGMEINSLRASNAELESIKTPEATAQMTKNGARIMELFGELDRAWPAGTLRYAATAVDTLTLQSDCSKFVGTVPTGDAAGPEDPRGAVAGGREMYVYNIISAIKQSTGICTSGVVVERVAVDGTIETGVLTNQHCGDVRVLRIGDEAVDVEKMIGSYLCDCMFVSTGDLAVDSNAVWTSWGSARVSSYGDFKLSEWVEFHGRNGYSLGRVLAVVDFGFTKAYVVDVYASHGDSGGPFIGLKDGKFGGMNSAGRDGIIDPGVSFGVAWSVVQKDLGTRGS